MTRFVDGLPPVLNGDAVSPSLSVIFYYSPAAGSLLYVIVSLIALSYTTGSRLQWAGS
ncbi:MAG: hypothetical protein NNA22_12750 [Nitrospira sp.]|nr:hypothetical protein [Nitrospira sp.]